LFTATVHRKAVEDLELVNITPEGSLKSSPKTEEQILELMRGDASITTEQLDGVLGITKRAVLKQVEKLKEQGRLRRVGPAKGGHWEVIE
jgi:ATP-dependent DNA helicase RecG